MLLLKPKQQLGFYLLILSDLELFPDEKKIILFCNI